LDRNRRNSLLILSTIAAVADKKFILKILIKNQQSLSLANALCMAD